MLFVHMEAHARLRGSTKEVPGKEDEAAARSRILKAILDREADHWERSAETQKVDPDPVLLRRGVAVATLAGAANEREAAELLAKVPDWKDTTDGARRKVARFLHRLYPGPDYLSPL